MCSKLAKKKSKIKIRIGRITIRRTPLFLILI
jgi:hypothetical protein